MDSGWDYVTKRTDPETEENLRKFLREHRQELREIRDPLFSRPDRLEYAGLLHLKGPKLSKDRSCKRCPFMGSCDTEQCFRSVSNRPN